MTELARTPRNLQRLFQTVDLAPLPQDCAVAESLDAWRERRGHRLSPPIEDRFRDQTRTVLDHSFLAEPLPGRRDFSITGAGAQVGRVLQCALADARLSRLPDRRLAARLRQLFQMARDYGEPVDVRFVDGQRGYEVLAAPVGKEGSKAAIFCTLTFDELQDGPH
jgi:hypothetical protein